MEDNDQKAELPIHVILGVGEYSKIKTKKMIKLENKMSQQQRKANLVGQSPLLARIVTSLDDVNKELNV